MISVPERGGADADDSQIMKLTIHKRESVTGDLTLVMNREL